jgi:hypothetical protein
MRGEWGVKRGQNAAPFPGEEGSSGRRERVGEVAAAVPDWASGGRRRLGSRTGWAHLSVRGRRRADWAGKGGRRWAAAELEKEGGGRAETVARAEIQE